MSIQKVWITKSSHTFIKREKYVHTMFTTLKKIRQQNKQKNAQNHRKC